MTTKTPSTEIGMWCSCLVNTNLVGPLRNTIYLTALANAEMVDPVVRQASLDLHHFALSHVANGPTLDCKHGLVCWHGGT